MNSLDSNQKGAVEVRQAAEGGKMSEAQPNFHYPQKGVIVLIALLALGIMLFSGLYFLSFTWTESRISGGQGIGAKTYYLAEAGIHEAVWKLQNGEPYKTCFTGTAEECPDCSIWSADFSKNNIFFEGDSYQVSIENSACGRGEIIATSTIDIGEGKTSQRVVKTKVRQATGGLFEDSALWGDGNIEVKGSQLNIYNGNLFSNGNLSIDSGGEINVYNNPDTEAQEGKVLVREKCSGCDTLSPNASATCAANICHTLSACECDLEKFEECEEYSCPPKELEIPMVDFDSDDPGSYLSKAGTAQEYGQCRVVGKDSDETELFSYNQCVFEEGELEGFLKETGRGGTLILEHKTDGTNVSTYYVRGNFLLEGEVELIVNGVLVVDGNIEIGDKKGTGPQAGSCRLQVENPGSGIPSGILTKGNIKFGSYFSSDILIEGIIYTLGNLELRSVPYRFEIIGGKIAAGNLSLTTIEELSIYLDNDIIREGIWGGPQPVGGEKPPYSPTVTIEHWEEVY